jgi:hypothetical protein
MNNLPESVKTKIRDEAMAFEKKQYNSRIENGYSEYDATKNAAIEAKGYTAAAEQILTNPGAWGMAAHTYKMPDAIKREDVLADLVKKYQPDINSGRSEFVLAFRLCHDWLREDYEKQQSAPLPQQELVDRVQRLEQALREIRELPIPMRDSCDWYHAVIKIATNALKTT